MKNKKVLLIAIGSLLLIAVGISISYAYYLATVSQQGENIVKTDCFQLTYEDEGEVTLSNTFPIRDSEANTITPYHFKIKNVCNLPAAYQVNLEVLNNTTLDIQYLNYKLDNGGVTALSTVDSETPTVSGATISKKLITGNLLAGEEKEYDLRVWLKESVTTNDPVQNKTFKSKVVVISTLNKDLIPKNRNAVVAALSQFNANDLKDVIMCDNTGTEDNLKYENCAIYNTIDEALADRNTGTIILTKDIIRENPIVITSEKNIVLEMNEKNVELNDTSNFAITTLGSLKIIGLNSSVGGSSPSINIEGYGNLLIDGGLYNTIVAKDNSNVTIKNASFNYSTNEIEDANEKILYAKNNAVLVAENVEYTAKDLTKFLHVNTTKTVKIKNSNIYCEGNCIYSNFRGSIDIDDSYIKAIGYAIRENSPANSGAVINVHNTTIESPATYSIRLDIGGTINIYDSVINSSSNCVKTTDENATGKINIYNSKLTSDNYYAVVNTGSTSEINIQNGTYIAKNYMAIGNNNSGTININQTNKPMYISSLVQEWKPAIRNNSTGSINITASQANRCTANSSDTTSGLCVYAVGNGTTTNNTGNGAVQNYSTGTINIDGGTFRAGHIGINNYSVDGSVNAKGIDVAAGKSLFIDYGGTINICNSTISSSVYDIVFNREAGTIKYSSDVIFTNGTNNPDTSKIYNPSNTGIINSGYTCPI